jgi:hypothetical protein
MEVSSFIISNLGRCDVSDEVECFFACQGRATVHTTDAGCFLSCSFLTQLHDAARVERIISEAMQLLEAA